MGMGVFACQVLKLFVGFSGPLLRRCEARGVRLSGHSSGAHRRVKCLKRFAEFDTGLFVLALVVVPTRYEAGNYDRDHYAGNRQFALVLDRPMHRLLGGVHSGPAEPVLF